MGEDKLRHLTDREILLRVASLATSTAVLASKVDGHAKLLEENDKRLRTAEEKLTALQVERATEKSGQARLVAALGLFAALGGVLGNWVLRAVTGH